MKVKKELLDKITDTVIAYRPARKSAAAKNKKHMPLGARESPARKGDVMYRVDRNNFFKVQKKATVYTPAYVSDFLYSILHTPDQSWRPNSGPLRRDGALLKPWKKNGYRTVGIDIEDQGFPKTIVKNYLEVKKGDVAKPNLVIMNPPFNIDSKTKQYIKENYGGRPLLPEVWFQRLYSFSAPLFR